MREEIAKKVFEGWYGILRPIWSSDYFKRLITLLQALYNASKKGGLQIFPPQKDVFRAFRLCKYSDFKVVIIGMDPYPNNKANGLSFSNSWEAGSMSPSLRKIREVIEDDYYAGLNLNFDQTLEPWAKQGVLLLNTALTIEEGKTGSHLKHWAEFTETLLKLLSVYNPGTIYCLWGKNAQAYRKFIDTNINHIIEAEHPAASIYAGRKWDFSFKQIDEITTKLYGENIKW